MHPVTEVEYKVLVALAAANEPRVVQDLAKEIGLDQSQVAATCVQRAASGDVVLHEERVKTFKLGQKGQQYTASGFPDRKIAEALAALGGSGEMPEVAARAGLDSKEVGQALKFLKARRWVEQNGKSLSLTMRGKVAAAGEGELDADELLVRELAQRGEAAQSELNLNWDAVTELLNGRTGVVEEKERVIRRAELSPEGRRKVSEGLEVRRQINALTSELLLSGDWKNVDLRPYDVTVAAEPVYPGKVHPLVRVFEQTRKVFLELGFEETVSPYVESSFWDFDALFQPQDHPARDMQDTFYVARPASCDLPSAEIVERVGRTHTDGGDTGSVGWRYTWDREMIKRPVLRTHTTASTIRALADNPAAPRKVFCVGPVFRRETVDYKHLPVFHQVDGIIIDDNASFANLLGTLKAFYSKMGFQKFQFRPAFFPYTEPSVEIFVWSEKKGDWVEMGGAGMFRPEVTRPLGCHAPVLAWGLGLERLAMFRYELSSIGELYRARLGWLKETPLCR